MPQNRTIENKALIGILNPKARIILGFIENDGLMSFPDIKRRGWDHGQVTDEMGLYRKAKF